MRVALDTNRITDLFRGDVELAEQLSTSEEIWIPLVIFSVQRQGRPEALSQKRLLFERRPLVNEPTNIDIGCGISDEKDRTCGVHILVKVVAQGELATMFVR